jgi:hypothetical protein
MLVRSRCQVSHSHALFFSFLGTLRSCFQTRVALELEILALRHQINVFRRSQRGRVRLTQVDLSFHKVLAGYEINKIAASPASILISDSAGCIIVMIGLPDPERVVLKPHARTPSL